MELKMIMVIVLFLIIAGLVLVYLQPHLTGFFEFMGGVSNIVDTVETAG